KKEGKKKILTLPYAPDDDADIETMTTILVRMSTSKNPLVRSSAARLMQKDDKERSGVISSAQANTHFLDSPMLRKNLERSDFSFKDLKTGDKPVTVYLVLPLDRLPTFNRWLRLNVVTALKDLMRIPHPKDTPQVRIILDEFAALERLDIVEKAYGTMAGLGVQLCAITQDLAQMERLYGKSWQTFISNAGVFQYFGSRDKMTADYASSLTGVATMKKRSFSTSRGSSGGGSSSSESTSYDDVQRPLAFPDELMTLPRHRQLLFIENRHPVVSDKIYWYQNSRLKALQTGTSITKNEEKVLKDEADFYEDSLKSKKVNEPIFNFDSSLLKKFSKMMIEPQKTTPEDFAKAREEKAKKNTKEDKKD
ncbi:MAG: type IV secretory system conjugative DNA transfer family protein, partial [Reichenbachiella sp.]